MQGPSPVRVVILYVHPLLGEGLARLLSAEPGIAAAAISEDDPAGTAAALASRPDVVIVESGEAAMSPHVSGDGSPPVLLFVDIDGAAGARGVGAITDDPDRVVRAVRDLQSARTPLVRA